MLISVRIDNWYRCVLVLGLITSGVVAFQNNTSYCVLSGIKVLQVALQSVPSPWTKLKKHSVGDTVRSTERLSSGTLTTTLCQSLDLEW